MQIVKPLNFDELRASYLRGLMNASKQVPLEIPTWATMLAAEVTRAAIEEFMKKNDLTYSK